MINSKLPLVDLHRHLEGSIRLQTALELAEKNHLPLPGGGLQGLQAAVWMREPSADILQIVPRFDLLRQILVDVDTCRRITLECIEDAVAEGLDYVEFRFSPLFMAELHGLDLMSVTGAVVEAWQEAERRHPLKVRLIAILSRTYGPEKCLEELKPALAYAGKGIVGLDLAGDEARWPAHLFQEHFNRARDAGLKLTAHAGEFAGSDSIRETIETLKPSRLGHAVHAADDPSVMDLISKEGITIESCATSNLFTCSVPDFKHHPLPLFIERNLRVTLNADDPSLFSGIGVRHEYEIAEHEMGLSPAQLDKLQSDGLAGAFLTDSEKRQILQNKTHPD